MKLLVFLLSLIGVALLGGVPVYVWDHHPHWQIDMPDPLPGHIGFPDSLATKYSNALAASQLAATNLATCHGNLSREDAALTAQNAAVAALKAQSDTWVAQSAQSLSAARAVAESYRQQAQAIAAEKPSSPDLCVSAEKVLREGGQ